jgi:hypothetical protein
MLNRGSGLALDGGVPIRVALEGESVLAENKSGLAVRLAQRGFRLLLSLDPSVLKPEQGPILRGRIGGGESWLDDIPVRDLPRDLDVVRLMK